MTKWTNEQLKAITLSGMNILVSAGAGSGKTAVLTERVIKKLQEKININELLILTFTNAAAMEMKERIRQKIEEHDDLKNNLVLLDSAYITTFDSYCLSLVKKYHYILNIDSNINIVDNSLISILKRNLLDDIFDTKYQMREDNFVNLISKFCLKNDTELKKDILKIYENINLKSNKYDYLDNYVKLYFNDTYINALIDSYLALVREEIDNIELQVDFIGESISDNYYTELTASLSSLLHANSYDEYKQSIDTISLPRRGKDLEEIADYKKQIDESIKILKNYSILAMLML